MSRNDLNMEELFRSQMESYSVDPSPGLWQKVHAKILWKQFLSFSFQTFNVYYLAAAISVAGLGSFALLYNPENPEQEQKVQTLSQGDTNIPEKQFTEAAAMNQETAEGEEDLTSNTETQVSGEQRAAVKSAVPRDATTENRQHPQASENQDTRKSSMIDSEPATGNQSEKESATFEVTAGFNVSMLSGCSPLAVSFENLSENAVQYNWIFSDGGSSTEKDPSYVFDVHGDYTVILKIIGKDGMEYSAKQTIRVFETPKALFELDEAADLSKNQPVYFYNYSRNADYFEWDFGDRQRSSLTDLKHYYDQPGSYNIKLKVWNDKQCYDSLVIMNAFTGPESEIRFPNAFTPNMTGPTGGSYEVNDINNAVFHPVVSGDLIEYQLKIFNRQGLQIFESNDAAFGWDGYYHEKLAAQNVYIWKVRGKFSNGKTFVKSGDVTLIRRY